MRGLVALGLLVAAPSAWGEELAGALGDMPDAGSAAWDREVAFRLLVEFDRNRSGRIDRKGEVAAIPCEVWRVLDEAIADEGEFPGLLVTYGFRRDLDWLGHVLGFHRRVRATAEGAMRACGVGERPPQAGPPLESLLRGLAELETPRDDGWDAVLSLLLTGAHDFDGSGRLDSVNEIADIGCFEWRAMDEVLRQEGRGPLVERYGLRPDAPWGGDGLNIDVSVREAVLASVRACGISAAGVGPPPPPLRSATDVAARIASVEQGGGSSLWDGAVRAVMIDAFDTDGTGVVDRPGEVSGIGCAVWEALDQGVAGGGTWSGLVEPYGLAPGAFWQGTSLGLGEGVRDEVWAALTTCLR